MTVQFDHAYTTPTQVNNDRTALTRIAGKGKVKASLKVVDDNGNIPFTVTCVDSDTLARVKSLLGRWGYDADSIVVTP